ncbi:MAG: MBL fold metallo-hydrolase [Planctomycetota bacterium]|jgi:L-ascorbate metabolism protein UlaG (beta-lactamase superfamily)
MRLARLFIGVAALGAVVCGCKNENTGTETTETTEEETGKETAMGITIQWLGHASFRICHEDDIIYIDPWKLQDSPQDATLVLVSHSHHDHYSPEDIEKVSGPETKLIASADVIAKENSGEAIMSGLTIELENARLTGVAAYNPNKQFHPKTNNWVGFVLELGSKRLYYAGDTDLTEEMKVLKQIDVALLPVGGTYTMDATEAAEAVNIIRPTVAIPYHWGDIVGGRNDAEKFADAAECDTRILTPGQTFGVE